LFFVFHIRSIVVSQPAKTTGFDIRLVKSSGAPTAMEAPESLGGEKEVVVVLGSILARTYLDPM
jgi:hypothetical protein